MARERYTDQADGEIVGEVMEIKDIKTAFILVMRTIVPALDKEGKEFPSTGWWHVFAFNVSGDGLPDEGDYIRVKYRLRSSKKYPLTLIMEDWIKEKTRNTMPKEDTRTANRKGR